MDSKVELFSQTLRFSPFWLGVDFLLIFHLFFSWYRSYKHTGWKVDVWYWTLFLTFFVYVLLMYPFNASVFNGAATGSAYSLLESCVDKAFAITLMGYLSIWMGRYLYDFMKEKTPFAILLLLVRPIEPILEKNISSRKCVLLVSFTAFFLFAAILILQVKNGFLFNPRGYFLQEDALRPLYNLTMTLFGFLLGFLVLRYVQFKDRMSKGLFFLILAFSLFMGIRSLAVYGILSLFLYHVFSRSGKVSFLKMGALCFGLIFLGICIESMRNASWDAFSSIGYFFVNVVYGNHFSDTRDFAWLLAYWDGEHLYGKTYVSGLLSFMPRLFSEFRQEWSWGIYAGRLAGFDPAVHPGLRPGLFGEVFFNFGYPGVLFLGSIVGYTLRYADIKMKEAVAQNQGVVRGYAGSLAHVVASSFFITAGFWGFYFFIFANLFLYCFYRIKFVR